jgi:hypothetical protein
MNYTLEYSLVRGCLRIRISGAWPAGRAEDIIAEMFSIWEKHQKPLIIDIRDMEDTPSVFRDYEEVGQFASVGFWRVGRIAVLDSPERRKANDFFETTAYNRGLRFAFFYSDEDEAVAWLLSEGE